MRDCDDPPPLDDESSEEDVPRSEDSAGGDTRGGTLSSDSQRVDDGFFFPDLCAHRCAHPGAVRLPELPRPRAEASARYRRHQVGAHRGRVAALQHRLQAPPFNTVVDETLSAFFDGQLLNNDLLSSLNPRLLPRNTAASRGQAVASNLCIALECLGLSPADVSASFCN
eukprot:jgi/Tetstr1/465726/TSEL_010351.t1